MLKQPDTDGDTDDDDVDSSGDDDSDGGNAFDHNVMMLRIYLDLQTRQVVNAGRPAGRRMVRQTDA